MAEEGADKLDKKSEKDTVTKPPELKPLGQTEDVMSKLLSDTSDPDESFKEILGPEPNLGSNWLTPGQTDTDPFKVGLDTSGLDAGKVFADAAAQFGGDTGRPKKEEQKWTQLKSADKRLPDEYAQQAAQAHLEGRDATAPQVTEDELQKLNAAQVERELAAKIAEKAAMEKRAGEGVQKTLENEEKSARGGEIEQRLGELKLEKTEPTASYEQPVVESAQPEASSNPVLGEQLSGADNLRAEQSKADQQRAQEVLKFSKAYLGPSEGPHAEDESQERQQGTEVDLVRAALEGEQSNALQININNNSSEDGSPSGQDSTQKIGKEEKKGVIKKFITIVKENTSGFMYDILGDKSPAFIRKNVPVYRYVEKQYAGIPNKAGYSEWHIGGRGTEQRRRVIEAIHNHTEDQEEFVAIKSYLGELEKNGAVEIKEWGGGLKKIVLRHFDPSKRLNHEIIKSNKDIGTRTAGGS